MSANRSSSGSTSWTWAPLTPDDAVDRLGDLALERALVGDLLLEVGGAELLLVEELEALVGAAGDGDALGGERDARLRGLRLVDGERGAVGAQLVGDALLVERGGDLAGLRRVEARASASCRRGRRRSAAARRRTTIDGQDREAEHGLRAAGQLGEVGEEGHGSAPGH